MMMSFGVMSFGLDLIPHVMSPDNYDVMMMSSGVMSFGLDLIPHVMSSDTCDVMMMLFQD